MRSRFAIAAIGAFSLLALLQLSSAQSELKKDDHIVIIGDFSPGVRRVSDIDEEAVIYANRLACVDRVLKVAFDHAVATIEILDHDLRQATLSTGDEPAIVIGREHGHVGAVAIIQNETKLLEALKLHCVPGCHAAIVGSIEKPVGAKPVDEMTGVLQQLEGIDENLFDVITDIMDEKREDYEEFLDEQDA